MLAEGGNSARDNRPFSSSSSEIQGERGRGTAFCTPGKGCGKGGKNGNAISDSAILEKEKKVADLGVNEYPKNFGTTKLGSARTGLEEPRREGGSGRSSTARASDPPRGGQLIALRKAAKAGQGDFLSKKKPRGKRGRRKRSGDSLLASRRAQLDHAKKNGYEVAGGASQAWSRRFSTKQELQRLV